ncbi:hypothetical protein AAIB33_06475 [Microbacterium sp. AZCO]|uniref:hypothetical protein n=1 Tax=Microbacterium sp. AZCO TaxID=3142976 RepID=UPI0031F447F1
MIPANHFPPPAEEPPLPRGQLHSMRTPAESLADRNRQIQARLASFGTNPQTSSSSSHSPRRVGDPASAALTVDTASTLDDDGGVLIDVDGRPMLIDSGTGAALHYMLNG